MSIFLISARKLFSAFACHLISSLSIPCHWETITTTTKEGRQRQTDRDGDLMWSLISLYRVHLWLIRWLAVVSGNLGHPPWGHRRPLKLYCIQVPSSSAYDDDVHIIIDETTHNRMRRMMLWECDREGTFHEQQPSWCNHSSSHTLTLAPP